MFIFTLIGEVIFWSPVIVCVLLGLLIDPKFYAGAGAVIAFWSGPFTPAILLQLGLIFLLKTLFGEKGSLKSKIAKIKAKFKELKDKEISKNDNLQ